MTNLQKQNLSSFALSQLQSLNQISGIQVHFDTLTTGNPTQFLKSYKLVTNNDTQSILYNGTSRDTTVYVSISGLLNGQYTQAQLVSGDLETLGGTMNATSIVQTITTESFNALSKYQEINLKSGYGIKLSMYDSTKASFIEVEVSVTKNPDKTPAEVQPNLKDLDKDKDKDKDKDNQDKKSGSNFLLILIIVILLLCALGGGGWYYYMKTKKKV